MGKLDRASQKSGVLEVEVINEEKEDKAKTSTPTALELDANRNVEELIFAYRENARKLSRSILRSWRVSLPLDEVYSLVDLALCEAATRYRADKGASFMTFLYYHLRGNLVRAIATSAKSGAMLTSFSDELGRELSIFESSSLPVNQSISAELCGYGAHESRTPDLLLLKKERQALCREAYRKLDTLEREVLGRAFSDDETLVDIANALGYSRCHISRVKRRALQQLRGHYENLSEEGMELSGASHKITTAASAYMEKVQQPKSRRGRRRRVLDSSKITNSLLKKQRVEAVATASQEAA